MSLNWINFNLSEVRLEGKRFAPVGREVRGFGHFGVSVREHGQRLLRDPELQQML
jgi:hypothetical protein